MTPLLWSILLSAVGILGILLAGSKRKLGWAIGFSTQGLWVVFAVTTGQYGFIGSAIAYGSVYARNWLKWRADERKAREAAETARQARHARTAQHRASEGQRPASRQATPPLQPAGTSPQPPRHRARA